MFGFAFGTLCLVGLFAVARGGRRGCGRYGGSRWDETDRDERGPGFFWRRLFTKLDTTPGQEKAIRAAVEEFRATARDVRGEVWRSKDDIAKALRQGYFDETAMGEIFSRHDTATDTFRKALVGMLAQIHEALDERQRGRLADFVESAGGWRRGPWSWA
jgi:hypothetical protein